MSLERNTAKLASILDVNSSSQLIISSQAKPLTSPLNVSSAGIVTAIDPFQGNSFKLLTHLGLAIKAETVLSKFHEAFASTLSSGATRFNWIYIPEAMTVTEILHFQKTVGNYTPTGTNNVALYTYDLATDTATLAANSADTPNLWAAPAGLVRTALTSSYNASAGLHLVAMRYQASAAVTVPTISARALDGSASGSIDGIKLAITMSANLPSTVVVNSQTATSTAYWLGLN